MSKVLYHYALLIIFFLILLHRYGSFYYAGTTIAQLFYLREYKSRLLYRTVVAYAAFP